MRVAGLLVAAAALVAGCDKNCQSTCHRVYSPSECNVVVPGVTADSMEKQCNAECEEALTQAGEMGDYNPYNQRDPTENFQLQNEKQAAEWMDCVWKAECEDLDPREGGVCYPI